MKNILITGGAGYIGSNCALELKSAGYNCIILDNFSEGHLEFVKDYKVFEVDLKNLKDVKEVFRICHIDAVVHFAASAYIGESVLKPEKYYYNNVVNTLNLLNAMKEFKVDKLIFSSSCATYGNPIYSPIDENHPQVPINPYGKTKFFIENILNDYQNAYGLKFVSLRYFNAAGANNEAGLGEIHRVETHLIPRILKTLTGELENITICGNDYPTRDGTCIRDYIHVKDLASAHKLALDYILSSGESEFINLGVGEGYSVQEIIHTVERVTGKKVPITIGERRIGDPHTLFCTNDKARDVLSWEPKYTDIEEIIKTAWIFEQQKTKLS